MSTYYIAEAARMLTANIVKQTGGAYLTQPLFDIVYKRAELHMDAEEIVDSVLNRICGEEGV